MYYNTKEKLLGSMGEFINGESIDTDSGDIAETFMRFLGIYSDSPQRAEIFNAAEQALYDLQIRSENPYDRDSFRVLFRLLGAVAEEMNT